MVQKIQPMGFSGRREEIVAPTVEKDPMARSEMMAPAAPSVLFSGSGYRKPNTTVRTTSSTVSAHSDQASQAAARSLIPRLLDPVPLPLLSQHYHSTALSSPKRYGKRYEEEVFNKRSGYAWRTSENRSFTRSLVSRARARNGYTSASSTSGSPPSVAEKRSSEDVLHLER